MTEATYICPACGGEDLSSNGSAYASERDERTDAPLMCEDCGWKGTAEEA